jgi:hypothetical protein
MGIAKQKASQQSASLDHRDNPGTAPRARVMHQIGEPPSEPSSSE